MKRLLSVLTLVLLILSSDLHAQDSTEKVVVLPFRVSTTTLKESTQEGFQQLKAYELEQGLLYQQAFYNALTVNGRHIVIEDIAVTNAKLKAAGIDLTKAYWMDKAVLCKLLKADAIITGIIQDAKISTRARLDADLGGNHFGSDRNEKRVLTMQLFDNASGTILWNLKIADTIDDILEADSQSLRKGLAIKIFKQISRYVPAL